MSGATLILSVNTATLGGSVCIVRGDEVLASAPGDPAVSHSSSLLADISTILKAAGVSLSKIDLLAAAAGPGSFTGLRIGVASIKAFSVALGRPCLGIPTLQAIAHSGGAATAAVALLPAGRGEVFAQMFSVSSDGVVTELDDAAHLSPRALVERYGALPRLNWVGEAALTQQEILADHAASKGFHFSVSPQSDDGWKLIAAAENLAADVAALAWQRFQRGESENARSLQAIYVRPSDAELKQN